MCTQDSHTSMIQSDILEAGAPFWSISGVFRIATPITLQSFDISISKRGSTKFQLEFVYIHKTKREFSSFESGKVYQSEILEAGALFWGISGVFTV